MFFVGGGTQTRLFASPSRDPSLHRPALSFLSGSEESRRAIPLEDDNERETLNHIIPVGERLGAPVCTPSNPISPSHIPPLLHILSSEMIFWR